MSRGSLTLFKNVFEEPTLIKTPDERRKGRSVELHDLRNECLVARYYYYGKFKDKRYSKILEELSREFFLSTVTIPEVLNDNFEILNDLRNQQPNENFFKKKWPHLVW